MGEKGKSCQSHDHHAGAGQSPFTDNRNEKILFLENLELLLLLLFNFLRHDFFLALEPVLELAL